MSEDITGLIEEIRNSQSKTLEAVKSLKQREAENLSSDIETIRQAELEIISEIESLIETDNR